MQYVIEYVAPDSLKPYPGNARVHSKRQIGQIARSIGRFGFNNPVLIDPTGPVIAGQGRLEAAKLLTLTSIPVIRLAHLSEIERRAYILADNKLAQNATWNADLLASEVQYLVEAAFEIEDIGFHMAEVDLILDEADERSGTRPEREDQVPALDPAGRAVSRAGDRWLLGGHVGGGGDARKQESYAAPVHSNLVFMDPSVLADATVFPGPLLQIEHVDVVVITRRIVRRPAHKELPCDSLAIGMIGTENRRAWCP